MVVLLLTAASVVLFWNVRYNFWWGVLGVATLLLSFVVRGRA